MSSVRLLARTEFSRAMNICGLHPRLYHVPYKAITAFQTHGFVRHNSQLPRSVDGRKLESNDWSSRIPKFPFHKDIAPTIIPKDTPRVTKDFSFKQLMQVLLDSREPEVVYVAESHRLYFLGSVALAFVAFYNLFDLCDRSIRSMIREYEENEEDLQPIANVGKVLRRSGLVFILAATYSVAGFIFATFPTRLIRRIEYLPGLKPHLRMVSHPWIPGRPSPVITVPLENVTIGKRAKVWTGDGFYGTANRSSFFFFLYEKGKMAPWMVDRNGWFWGDGRVYDVLLGKEPIDFAEKGLSHDDLLKIKMNEKSKRETELRRQLGPAWRAKSMGNLMKEDYVKLSQAARKVVKITGKNGDQKSIEGEILEKSIGTKSDKNRNNVKNDKQ
jgi:hypothetical protein